MAKKQETTTTTATEHVVPMTVDKVCKRSVRFGNEKSTVATNIYITKAALDEIGVSETDAIEIVIRRKQ